MKKMPLPAALLAASALMFAAHAGAQTHQLTQLWESEASLKLPESVLYDARNQVLYVSNIDGDAWADDGKGSIARLGLDGKVLDAEWVTGLSCPKGMALSPDGRLLYAVDAGGIVAIDIRRGKIAKKIAIPEGVQLNDLVSDGKGTLYVSDSKGRKVYAVTKNKAAVFLDESVLKGPNGLLVHEGRLLVLDDNSLKRVREDKTLEVLADGMAGGTDGVEHVGGNEFLVSIWSGGLWYVRADGDKQLLFDGRSHAPPTRTADLGWNPERRVVYVPTFGKNTVIAFKVD